jgi:hypothetical protein
MVESLMGLQFNSNYLLFTCTVYTSYVASALKKVFFSKNVKKWRTLMHRLECVEFYPHILYMTSRCDAQAQGN